jgi:hypothetical protein
MKPFNLERAIAGDPLISRCGHKVEFIAHDPTMDFGSRIVIKIYRANGPEWMLMSDAGRYWSVGPDTNQDVFMAPIEKTVWVNVYPGLRTGNMPIVYFYHTQEDADKQSNASTRVGGKAFPFTYTE